MVVYVLAAFFIYVGSGSSCLSKLPQIFYSFVSENAGLADAFYLFGGFDEDGQIIYDLRLLIYDC